MSDVIVIRPSPTTSQKGARFSNARRTKPNSGVAGLRAAVRMTTGNMPASTSGIKMTAAETATR
jgi:hypothetical protein